MADFIFDAYKGTVGYYAKLPAANDGLVLIPLQASGLAADSVLQVKTTLAQILTAGVATEQTTMGHKVITSTTSTVDNTNHRVDITATMPKWTAPAGASISKLLLCYDPDTTTGTDADLIPLMAFDTKDGSGTATTFTPDGTSDFQVNLLVAAGFYRAA